MKSTKLTNTMRDDLIGKIIKSSKAHINLEALSKKEEEVFIDIRDFLLGKNKETYLSLPKSLQKFDGSICIDKVPEHRYVYIYIENNVACPLDSVIFEDLTKKIQNKLLKFLNDKKQFNKAIDEIRSSAKTILYSCNTTKQLLEVMSEAKELLDINVISNLPAVTTQQVDGLRSLLK